MQLGQCPKWRQIVISVILALITEAVQKLAIKEQVLVTDVFKDVEVIHLHANTHSLFAITLSFFANPAYSLLSTEAISI